MNKDNTDRAITHIFYMQNFTFTRVAHPKIGKKQRQNYRANDSPASTMELNKIG